MHPDLVRQLHERIRRRFLRDAPSFNYLATALRAAAPYDEPLPDERPVADEAVARLDLDPNDAAVSFIDVEPGPYSVSYPADAEGLPSYRDMVREWANASGTFTAHVPADTVWSEHRGSFDDAIWFEYVEPPARVPNPPPVGPVDVGDCSGPHAYSYCDHDHLPGPVCNFRVDEDGRITVHASPHRDDLLPHAPSGSRYLTLDEAYQALVPQVIADLQDASDPLAHSLALVPDDVNTTVHETPPVRPDVWTDTAQEVYFPRRAVDPLPRHSPSPGTPLP